MVHDKKCMHLKPKTDHFLKRCRSHRKRKTTEKNSFLAPKWQSTCIRPRRKHSILDYLLHKPFIFNFLNWIEIRWRVQERKLFCQKQKTHPPETWIIVFGLQVKPAVEANSSKMWCISMFFKCSLTCFTQYWWVFILNVIQIIFFWQKPQN